jgi:hypothetical protein
MGNRSSTDVSKPPGKNCASQTATGRRQARCLVWAVSGILCAEVASKKISLQFIEDLEAELCAFRLLDRQAQQFLLPVGPNAQRQRTRVHGAPSGTSAAVVGIAHLELAPVQRDGAAGRIERERSGAQRRILGISIGTVNFHVNNSVAKFGVRSKIQAAVHAALLGLLS